MEESFTGAIKRLTWHLIVLQKALFTIKLIRLLYARTKVYAKSLLSSICISNGGNQMVKKRYLEFYTVY